MLRNGEKSVEKSVEESINEWSINLKNLALKIIEKSVQNTLCLRVLELKHCLESGRKHAPPQCFWS